MHTFRRLAKPVSYAVVASLLAFNLHLPVSRAALVGTEAVVQTLQTQQERDRLRAALDRVDVQQRLVALGVDPAQVQARVDALTDDEASRLAKQMDELPAGGDALGLLVFVFLVLLITDVLGLTDIFPFVKKQR
jgi:hypothetical protein